MKQGKMTKLLINLQKKPMAYGEMHGFLFALDDDGSYPREELAKKYQHPYGYNCTNISTMIYNNNIEKRDNLYYLTQLGQKSIQSPYKLSAEHWKTKCFKAQRRANINFDRYVQERTKAENLAVENDRLTAKVAKMESILKDCAKNEFNKVLNSELFNNDLLSYLGEL